MNNNTAKIFRDHVSLPCTPETWPLNHFPNLSIVSHAINTRCDPPMKRVCVDSFFSASNKRDGERDRDRRINEWMNEWTTNERWNEWKQIVSWRTNEWTTNFFFLLSWSTYARKFSAHATILVDSWPISQLRMISCIRCGSGRWFKKQVPPELTLTIYM